MAKTPNPNAKPLNPSAKTLWPKENHSDIIGGVLVSQKEPRDLSGNPWMCVGSPTVPKGTAGEPAETRGWSTFACHRRASLQEPCADLCWFPTGQHVARGKQQRREAGVQLRVSAGLLYRSPAMTYLHIMSLALCWTSHVKHMNCREISWDVLASPRAPSGP